jgi:CheY-like chemotaxis protein
MDAPAAMWERKKKERNRFVFTNAPLETLTRPLVLVVDDEDEIRAVAVRAVQDLGLSVVVAHNGLEGIDVAARYKPDIVVTDAMMPKLDGREMCLRIKENPETSGSKVVVLTSLYTDPRYKHEAMKTFHADAYLSKPVEPQKLREVLQRFLA